jgi:hypothetical protein
METKKKKMGANFRAEGRSRGATLVSKGRDDVAQFEAYENSFS